MKEQFPSPSNLPPGDSLLGKIRFVVKNLGDLQVSAVLIKITPWLKSRRGQVLEVGCGLQPYRHLVTCEYTGLDWEKSNEHFGYKSPYTVYYSGSTFPFEDNSFDSVFATAVLEHIYDYKTFLKECRRVLKPEGDFLLTVPFQARYHYIPLDYWRFTKSALQTIVEEAGFKELEITSLGNDVGVAAYKNLSLVYRWLLHGNVSERFLGVISAPIGFCCILVGQIAIRLDIGSKDDCLGYAVIAKRRGR